MNKMVKSGMIVLTGSLIISSLLGHNPMVHAQPLSRDAVTEIASFNPQASNASAVKYSTAVVKSFKDLPTTHWAYASVQAGVNHGYIAGYQDNTFKPSKPVTRAEFMKMVAIATEIPLGKDNSKWYLPALNGLQTKGWVTKNDFADKNYNKEMTRLEMAKLAVRAIGETADSDAKHMLIATERGLISGMGDGNLNINGTTTRAEAVAIMERVLVVNNGGTLPVDAKAVAAANDLVGARTDAWGDSIRTVNLPKTAADYVYILQYFPNAGYEMGVGPYASEFGNYTKPNELFAEKHLTVANLGGLKKNVEDWFNLFFNLDYRTIDYSWADKIFKTYDLGQYTPETKAKFINGLKVYVDWVKENKLVTKGTAKAEPSTIRQTENTYIRVYYEYQVVSGNRSAIVASGDSNTSIFRGSTDKHSALYSKDYQFGQVIKVVSEINVTHPKGDSSWNSYKINKPDLSKNFVIIK